MTVCTFTITPSLLSPLSHQLQQGNFLVHAFHDSAAFSDFVQETRQHIDCLVLENHPESTKVLQQFKSHDILLPTVFLVQAADGQGAIAPHEGRSSSSSPSHPQASSGAWIDKPPTSPVAGPDYHNALYLLWLHQLDDLSSSIEQAIDGFLRLRPPTAAPEIPQ
ncbi:MAG: hypothetical protein AB4042_08585, partial [Leptolyngbyaceae cyanobacterium]